MLPGALLLLISSVLAQQQQKLALNSVLESSFNGSNSSPATFQLPSSTAPLNVSVSLCTNQLPFPRFFLSNASNTDIPSINDTGPNVVEIIIDQGLGTWEGDLSNGGVLAVYNGNVVPGVLYPPWTFQLGVSNGDPLHEPLSSLPLLGDSTSSQALLFSPTFDPYTPPEPSFPQYTLPPANTGYPSIPSSLANYTLALFPTSNYPALSKSACGILSELTSSSVLVDSSNATVISRGNEGFRMQWIIENLRSSTNSTFFVLQDNLRVSEPIFFATKSSSFACQLVHSLPFCPKIAYSAPLPPPSSPLTSYNATTLDSSISAPLISSLQNFSSSLSVFACGRDLYSPIQTCSNCFAAYRDWMCAVTFPQCSDPPVNPSTFVSPSPPGLPPTPALITLPANTTRSPILSPLSTTHTVVLPCIESCQAVDRACPPMMQWRCPVAGINANQSYGLGFIDGVDGLQGEGRVGGLVSGGVDRWGGIWCSGL